MLLGEYAHTIDDKNRLTLPVKLRGDFADGGVVTRGLDECLYLFPRERWDLLVDTRLGDLDLLSEEGRVMQRYFFANAQEIDPDKQGRIMLPATLLERARIGREVVVAGVFDHLEIWDRAQWAEQLRQVEGSAQHAAERLAAKRD
jgi:MraZ protein